MVPKYFAKEMERGNKKTNTYPWILPEPLPSYIRRCRTTDPTTLNLPIPTYVSCMMHKSLIVLIRIALVRERRCRAEHGLAKGAQASFTMLSSQEVFAQSLLQVAEAYFTEQKRRRAEGVNFSMLRHLNVDPCQALSGILCLQ